MFQEITELFRWTNNIAAALQCDWNLIFEVSGKVKEPQHSAATRTETYYDELFIIFIVRECTCQLSCLYSSTLCLQDSPPDVSSSIEAVSWFRSIIGQDICRLFIHH